MPTIPVKEIDRTAAGDIFDGAFVYGIGKGYDIEKCMRIANIAAGLSTTKMGGKDSIPLLSDVIQYYESKFGPLEPVVAQNVAEQNPAPADNAGNSGAQAHAQGVNPSENTNPSSSNQAQ